VTQSKRSTISSSIDFSTAEDGDYFIYVAPNSEGEMVLPGYTKSPPKVGTERPFITHELFATYTRSDVGIVSVSKVCILTF